MELTKKQVNITKGIAILFMLLLHLFCRKDIAGYYDVLFKINEVPLVYCLALFGDCCVAIYCFCSGYGLLLAYKNDTKTYMKKNIIRLFKLYINYWIILVIFVLGLGFIMEKTNVYPGNLKTFLLNFIAVEPTYNGAWWFLTTYIILVLVSSFINKIIIKYDFKIILFVSLILYFFAYIQRIRVPIVFDHVVLDWFMTQLALFGTSQLPFIVGGVFAHKKIYSQLYNIAQKIKFKTIVAMSLIISLVIFHSFVETLFVAPFTGIGFICLFNLMDKPNWINNALTYLSTHSTNMWLIHMFFYAIYFKELVFYPKYPMFIFPWLIILCLGASHIINYIYDPIIKLLDKKLAAVSEKLYKKNKGICTSQM